jgi:N-acetyl-alpha-D-muramate 1-phosphate uridylyltransferase
MKAMLFAAGLGTRLQPLTNDRPKALVEINGKTLLQHAIEHLKKHGIRDIIVNIHHFGDKVLQILKAHQNFGCNITISDERATILETGGGLLKVAPLLKNQTEIVLYNVDVLSNIDLKKMLSTHKAKGNHATLAVRNRSSSRYLQFDSNGYLCGWINTQTGKERTVRNSLKKEALAFSGIHIISTELINAIEERGKFSITQSYLNLADRFDIAAYPHDEDYWFDVGKPEKLKRAKEFLSK